jgi:hypothetical protein
MLRSNSQTKIWHRELAGMRPFLISLDVVIESVGAASPFQRRIVLSTNIGFHVLL